MTQSTIALVIPYFGEWEPWAPLFFETARRNATIDFFVFTNCDPQGPPADNIFYHRTSFEGYCRRIGSTLPGFRPTDPYKICDYRPMFGRIHEEEFRGYDFWGWCDVDLLLGNIRAFYTEEVLRNNDVLSTHSDRISGHFALFRNTQRNRLLYQKIYDWEGALRKKEFVGIDEHGVTHALLMTIFDRVNEKFGWGLHGLITDWAARRRRSRVYFVEQYTTPFLPIPWLDGSLNSDQPASWLWKNGIVSNTRDRGRAFMYLHLMNFKSSRWRHDGTKAPWAGRGDICSASIQDMKDGIVIDDRGIRPLRHEGSC